MRKYFIILIVLIASTNSFSQDKGAGTNNSTNGDIIFTVVDPDEKDPDLDDDGSKTNDGANDDDGKIFNFKQRGIKTIIFQNVNAYIKRAIASKYINI